MPGETITLQVGQCGNQVALQYWNQLAAEHGIQADGLPLAYPDDPSSRFQSGNTDHVASQGQSREDRPELFFTLSDSNKYTPKAVLVDLEPSVIHKATNALPMFNPRNVHLSEHGSGAANNWQQGYSYGLQYQEELLNLIDREVDKCENVSNFQLFHSVAGGTGAGVGSLLLELLSDRFGSKKLINTFLIFPSNEKTSDVVVQPYNTVLTLKRLIDYADSTFVFHNDALNSIENLLFNTGGSRNSIDGQAAFEGANKIIAYVAATISNPLRFPNYMHTSHESIYSTLVPTPDLKFLTTSVAPFTSQVSRQSYTNEYEIILELLNDRYKLNRVTEPIKYISVLNYLIGNNLNQEEIRKGTTKVQQRLNFVPWTPSSVQCVNGRKSLFGNNSATKGLTGIQISNNTSIVGVFTKILKQYDLLAKREAYINSYTESNDAQERARVMGLFNECRESVALVVEEYKACQSVNYLEDDILDEDEVM
ncbi:gamma-tubulin [Suhomyces tanzawaensis NRRL Y-17324]|uniref:Tubulin gamma chain n=1 Tax=Suhomyces tanzawaensis NRRL Y-17324 TaxID=984487 RepID=A0A1E4SBT9_9ASCO|nr:gamma-tubulin [Suhomyces tanzawaensis NRRL Y-17324]ODV76987.1 gamma-tubulin [Suhomyces tanzawaensis NRRL Y-17324]